MTVGHSNVPFLNYTSFTGEETEAQETESRATLAARSPFVSVYELADGESVVDNPLREAYSTLVDELMTKSSTKLCSNC